MVFHKLNLNAPDARYPEADLILLRNVLKYFDPDTRAAVLAKIRAALRPEGYLVLGEDETAGRTHGFEPVHAGKISVFRLINETSQPDEFSI